MKLKSRVQQLRVQSSDIRRLFPFLNPTQRWHLERELTRKLSRELQDQEGPRTFPQASTQGMVPVSSSNLKAVGFSPFTKTLRVQFKGGRTYAYFGVPQRLYHELLRAQSKGGFFSGHIRNRYSFRKLS